MKAVKILRVLLSLAILIVVALLIVCDRTEWLHRSLLTINLAWFSLGALVVWLVITLLLGRVYCSTACPLGTLQDVAAWIAKRVKSGGNGKYRFEWGNWRLRVIVVLLIGVSLTARDPFIGLLSDPLTVTERVLQWLVQPAVMTLLGMLASAVVVLGVMGLAWSKGRTFCNTVCPVGTALGAVSQISLLQMEIDPDLCMNCGRCEMEYKALCIDAKAHTVDSSRCVLCFNCGAVCPAGAIKYHADRKRLSTPLLQRTPSLGVQAHAES